MDESEVTIILTLRATIKADSKEAFEYAALSAVRENIVFKGLNVAREVGAAIFKNNFCSNWRLKIHEIEIDDVI